MIAFVVTAAGWTIFQYDTTQQQGGAPCQPSVVVVHPGHYILLSSGENLWSLPDVALILHQLVNLFVSAWFPLCGVLVIPQSPTPKPV